MPRAAGKLTIDLRAVRENYAIVRSRLSPGCRAAAVVKADAYGLGAARVAPALEQAGCRDFFVSSLDEGLDLREAISLESRIYILNGFYSSGSELYLERGLIPVLGSFMEIEGYRALARKRDVRLPVFLKFNTRMNRMGMGKIETVKLIENPQMLDGLDVRGIMSHFACADEADNPMNDLQHDIFTRIAAHFPGVDRSLCNSSGLFRDGRYHFEMVRPGMALYGLNPVPEQANPMKPVVRLSVPVIRLRIVYADSVVGYNATYRFEKDSQIATVSAGYADGIFRSLSNRGALYWNGYRCPIRGRVSMDLTTVDLSGIPDGERPRPGDMLELLGQYQGADALAADAGTIGYEILTALGGRYERVYAG